jgi:hypothetical protein
MKYALNTTWYGYGFRLANLVMKASSLYLKTAIIIALAMVILTACQKKIEADPSTTNSTVPNGKIAPDGFNISQ